MPKITDGDIRKFREDKRCRICHKLIPASTTCYVRQQVLVGDCHKVWLEKNVAPDPSPERRKRKLRPVSQKELQDLRDTARYTEVFSRHLTRESKNVVGIKRVMKDYEGTSRDWY